ncbi:carbohydrate esterase family 4 protein [Phlebiopsis gigantea 11061_1 CR5-6]|uniref:chitin deacetylase n=1 Tax=Phlebiopsis gigantea (strain 11061_1 CR5-6) TaxID=745531 RepID=A0A0C3S3P6_PHLG1|nr:carbohydrate esterase family 4 protein [Phlebiopsis gigantea 11061_1 CR5-6]
MKLEAAVVLAALFAGANAHGNHNHHARHHARDDAAAAAVAASSGAATGTPATAAASSASIPTATEAGIPALQSITSGMPTGTTAAVTATYAVGSTPSNLPSAPPLPTAFVFVPGTWPAQDIVAPTNSTQVAQWMKELEGIDIPDLEPTQDGDCSTDPAFAADAQNRGWWTCGGWTATTDIVACPDKWTWGVSFDDGPSAYTQNLLNFLDEKDLRATFFAVGSRIIERPNVLVEEYMKGHEIAVHTWSHHPLTSLTNEQIVAELGWSREAIKTVLGVTPTTMRPPYGDIDNRVRAISMAMGLTPIMWTATPGGLKFDTNDWRVAGGQMTGVQQFESFEQLLGNASAIDTGFIVLEHDLFEITVDLAIGYTLNAALTHNPPFTLKPIGQCSNIPTTDMYQETTKNQTYLAARKAALSHVNGTSSSNSTTSAKGSTPSSSSSSSSAEGAVSTGAAVSNTAFGLLPVFTALLAAGIAMVL